MANSISSVTTGTGGIVLESVDTSGNTNIKSGTTTIVAVTSTGAAVTGTLSATGAVTIPSVAGSFYDEGTFSPTIIGTSTAGTATYGVQVGRYTKVGRLVTIQIYMGWSAGTGTGNLTIGNLPFTSATTVYQALTIPYQQTLTVPANSIVGAYIAPSSTAITIASTAVAGGNTAALAYDAAADVIIAGSYII